MSADRSALLVVDMQEKLLPSIPSRNRLIWNIRRLIDGAKLLGIPAVGTEQYPSGLGPTTPDLAERLGPLPDKLMFSCRECHNLFADLQSQDRDQLLVVGIETHVCVAQTVLDLLSECLQVSVAVDAVGSRHAIDHDTALRRMETHGATLTTTEAALFEWCEAAGTDTFKQISRLVREDPPSD